MVLEIRRKCAKTKSHYFSKINLPEFASILHALIFVGMGSLTLNF